MSRGLADDAELVAIAEWWDEAQRRAASARDAAAGAAFRESRGRALPVNEPDPHDAAEAAADAPLEGPLPDFPADVWSIIIDFLPSARCEHNGNIVVWGNGQSEGRSRRDCLLRSTSASEGLGGQGGRGGASAGPRSTLWFSLWHLLRPWVGARTTLDLRHGRRTGRIGNLRAGLPCLRRFGGPQTSST